MKIYTTWRSQRKDLHVEKLLEAKTCVSSEANNPCHRSGQGTQSPNMKIPQRSTSRHLELVASWVSTCIYYSHVRALFSMPFFPWSFWDGVFSEAHTCRLRRAILVTRVRVLFAPHLVRASIRTCCPIYNPIVEDYCCGSPWDIRVKSPPRRSPTSS
jgi:hypothetical protein